MGRADFVGGPLQLDVLDLRRDLMLGDFRDPPLSCDGSEYRGVVFVHGICSNHKPFQTMANDFIKDEQKRFVNWSIRYFDYDYHQPMTLSAQQLHQQLQTVFSKNNRVVLICHSMGGLIARLALLQYRPHLEFITRVVMLGTPN